MMPASINFSFSPFFARTVFFPDWGDAKSRTCLFRRAEFSIAPKICTRIGDHPKSGAIHRASSKPRAAGESVALLGVLF
jgi:hypothetical protein